MKFDEFMAKAVAAFPSSTVGEDNDGQLVVYTNLHVIEDEVVEFDSGAVGDNLDLRSVEEMLGLHTARFLSPTGRTQLGVEAYHELMRASSSLRPEDKNKACELMVRVLTEYLAIETNIAQGFATNLLWPERNSTTKNFQRGDAITMKWPDRDEPAVINRVGVGEHEGEFHIVGKGFADWVTSDRSQVIFFEKCEDTPDHEALRRTQL